MIADRLTEEVGYVDVRVSLHGEHVTHVAPSGDNHGERADRHREEADLVGEEGDDPAVLADRHAGLTDTRLLR
jgi:hypothetical protein